MPYELTCSQTPAELTAATKVLPVEKPTQQVLNAARSVLFTALMPKHASFWAVP
jgi:hypothetical protein